MSTCIFSELNAKVVGIDGLDGYSITTEEFGEYFISREAYQAYGKSLSQKQKFLCLQESIKISDEGATPYWTVGETISNDNKFNIVNRVIDDVNNITINHSNKEKDILSLLSYKLSQEINPFIFTNISKREMYKIGIFTKEEIEVWLDFLVEKGFIEYDVQLNATRNTLGDSSRFYNTIQKSKCIRLTVKGWEYVRQMYSKWNSNKVFIAMAFTNNEKMRVSSDLRDCIKKALESTGWEPLIVDEIDHNDGIMDKVIASIHESRFVIAELTHQKTGVYYEAGYAKGRGLQVIHIVKKNDIEQCHFDVKHLNLILWENLEELTIKLKNRIRATII